MFSREEQTTSLLLITSDDINRPSHAVVDGVGGNTLQQGSGDGKSTLPLTSEPHWRLIMCVSALIPRVLR